MPWPFALDEARSAYRPLVPGELAS
jgi:hypothetical protein